MEVDDPGLEGQGLESKSSDLLVATGAPFLLGLSYVGSLYVWRSTKDRDHDDGLETECEPWWPVVDNCERLGGEGALAWCG